MKLLRVWQLFGTRIHNQSLVSMLKWKLVNKSSHMHRILQKLLQQSRSSLKRGISFQACRQFCRSQIPLLQCLLTHSYYLRGKGKNRDRVRGDRGRDRQRLQAYLPFCRNRIMSVIFMPHGPTWLARPKGLPCQPNDHLSV